MIIYNYTIKTLIVLIPEVFDKPVYFEPTV